MHDVAVKRRLATLVIAALLAISAAALATAVLAADAQAKGLTGTGGDDTLARVNDGDAMNGALRGLAIREDAQDLRVNDGDAMDGALRLVLLA